MIINKIIINYIWNEKLNNNWSTNIAFNYTRGKGFFEQLKEDRRCR